MNTETQYYYLEKGEVCGPLSAAYIRGLLRTGRITAETEVCEDGSQAWQPLYQFEELSVPASEITPRKAKPSAGVPSGAGFYRHEAHGRQIPQQKQGAEPARTLAEEERRLYIPEPPVAAIIHGLAWFVAAGGLVGFAVGVENDSAFLALASIFASCAWAVFVYSWSCALTWLYNIMLNTQKEAGKAEGKSEKS